MLVLAAVSVLVLASCDSYLQEEPKDFLSPENFPASAEDAEAALGGAMSEFTTSQYYDRAMYFLSEISSDHTTVGYGPDHRRQKINSYTYNSSNTYIEWVWESAYNIVNSTNILIQRVPDIQGMTQQQRDQYVGAAKYLRAFNYFNLVRLWGPIPLLKKPVESFGGGSTRADVATVYDLIVSDLQDAQSKLPASWPGGAGKPTKGAAQTLLSKVYLTMSGPGSAPDANRWQEAANMARQVIDSGEYRLVEDYSDLWLIKNKNGPEHIWSIQFHSETEPYGKFAVQSRPRAVGDESGWALWYTYEELMSTYKDKDERKAPSFLTEIKTEEGTIPYTQFNGTEEQYHEPFIEKWTDPGRENLVNFNQRTNTNIPIFRFAEVLLMAAEAINEANGGPTAEAYEYINQVRNRAGLSDLSGLSKAEFHDAIKQERTYELAFEMKRRFDLIRWGDFVEEMNDDPAVDVTISDQHKRYPIPQVEIDVTDLEQNPGYGE
jgi:hypothetical protein